MMNELTVFNYEGNDIAFDFGEGQKMINATQMAKAFGKQPRDFLKTQPTKDFIKVLSAKTGILATDLVKVINGGQNFGTWLHEKLALEFSRWLSPEFGIWCNDKIIELMTTGRASIAPQSEDTILAQAMNILNNRLAAANETIIELQPNADYAQKVLKSTTTYTITEIANELGMSGRALNKKLKDLKVQYYQSERWMLYAKYQGKGLAKTKTFPYMGSNDEIKTKSNMVWTEKGRLFIHQLINPELEKVEKAEMIEG